MYVGADVPSELGSRIVKVVAEVELREDPIHLPLKRYCLDPGLGSGTLGEYTP